MAASVGPQPHGLVDHHPGRHAQSVDRRRLDPQRSSGASAGSEVSSSTVRERRAPNTSRLDHERRARPSGFLGVCFVHQLRLTLGLGQGNRARSRKRREFIWLAGNAECLHARFSARRRPPTHLLQRLAQRCFPRPVPGRAPFLGDCTRPRDRACSGDAIEPPKRPR